MTNKITKEFLFTELSIKIATLEMKIDKLIELAMNPEPRKVDISYTVSSPVLDDEEFGESFK